jgi:tRNA(adenine34) deaminase
MDTILYSDEYFMREALKEAKRAFEADEVPIGAVVVSRNTVIGRGHNLTERLKDITAHAEMQAITAACNYIGAKYLDECTLYVTIEPCAMCAGAASWAQLGRIVYGAPDEKKGYSRFSDAIPHPKTKVEHGVLAADCAALMKDFFQKKR